MTALPISTRFYAPPLTRIRWLATIAASALKATEAGYLVPTTVEWAAGVDLSDEVADLSGFAITDAAVETPGLSAFTGSLPGRLTAGQSSISFYASEDGEDVRGVLVRGQNGYVAIADAGDAAASLADIFPARVGALGKPRSVTGSTAQLITVPFHITRQPGENIVIPAAV